MLRVRTTKTTSGKTAVQVVFRQYQQTIVKKHLGTANSQKELVNLLKLAKQFIEKEEKLRPLWLDQEASHQLISLANLEIDRLSHRFAYQFFSQVYAHNGFEDLSSQLLKDLAIIRIIEPASKLRSLKLLDKYFGLKYTEALIYKNLPELSQLKSQAETIAVNYAKKYLGFDFSLVFYDVTTLYFEAFTDDDLRKCGFSKDNKFNQPQILIALVVNCDGYPVAYQTFAGNKFEGHTFIPTILKLKEKYKIIHLTIVADAAMLSEANIQELVNHGLNYIVGARMSNLPLSWIKEIADHLNCQEDTYWQKSTKRGFLICAYSAKRAAKDKSDRTKQLQKAAGQIAQPSSAKKLKFIKEETKAKLTLNQELIDKAESLEGIKGYYTNLDPQKVTEKLIIARYQELWQIEKSFRMAKSDLSARPIFHRKKENIEAHLLIIFISLCLAKSIELKTNLSLKRVKEMFLEVVDVELKDRLTEDKFLKRTKISQELLKLRELFN